MIIQRLQTGNFGCLGDEEFEFTSGLNIIRGPNEAGKSTLQAALLTVLFQKADTTSQVVHRWQSWGANNLFELALEFTAAGHQWRLEKDFADEEVCLADLDSGEEWTDHSQVQDKMAQLLGTGSPDIYESTAAIRQQQITALQAGGELSDLLQQSVSGSASGVSVSDTIQRLDGALGDMRRGLERAAPVNPGPLHLIQEEIVRLEGEIRQLEETGQKVSGAWRELREAETQLEQLQPQIGQAEQLLEKADRRRKLEGELDELEDQWTELYRGVERWKTSWSSCQRSHSKTPSKSIAWLLQLIGLAPTLNRTTGAWMSYVGSKNNSPPRPGSYSVKSHPASFWTE